MSYQSDPDLDKYVRSLGENARILDIGGWYAPYPLATHVVDIMPYETRAEGNPPAGERYTVESWVQADITDPNFRLPFRDNFFDFSLCMNTLEDLHEVRPILREMNRTCRAGLILIPSRYVEQTIGVSDRMSSRLGFNHHKWIVDVDENLKMTFHDKAESFYQQEKDYVIPLSVLEKGRLQRETRVIFQKGVQFELCHDFNESRRLAKVARQTAEVGSIDVAVDRALRFGRRMRERIRGGTVF